MRGLRALPLALLAWPCAAFSAGIDERAATPPPPLFEIEARTLYDAGVQQGRLAAERIRTWFASTEMSGLFSFARGQGRAAFEQLKRDNAAAFPQYAEEMRGIADGAKVPLDEVWVANLISELQGLQGDRTGSHCSDLYAVTPGGYEGGFGHGHNEDWSEVVKPLWYYVKYTALPGANFSSCAGLAYPATLIGWAPTWNAHSMYLTQNSLYPREARAGGFSCVFIQREAICGRAPATSLEHVVRGVTQGNWSYGASINIVDLRARRMANVETSADKSAVRHVTEAMGNYSHFNMYKNLGVGRLDPIEVSTVHRQARVDSLPAPRSLGAIASLLSDRADAAYPVLRRDTLTTMLLDGATGRMDVWCCGNPAIGRAGAAHSWNLSTFFDGPVAGSQAGAQAVLV